MMPVANEIGKYQSASKLQFSDQKCTLENMRAFRDVGRSSTSCAVARNSSNRNGLHLRQTLFFFTEHNNIAGLNAHANDRILFTDSFISSSRGSSLSQQDGLRS